MASVTWRLEQVAPPSPGEIRFLHRIGAGRAHRRLAAYVEAYTAAMAADAAAKRSAARDDEDLERLQEDYVDQVVSQHGRAAEAAWAEHRHCLERASSSGLADAARAHNRQPCWLGLHALQGVAARSSRLLPTRSTRPRARQHRARAMRRRALSRSSSRSADPGDDDPHDDDGPGTFASFHRATLGLTGAQRLRAFESLPEERQDAYWLALAAEIERGRR